MSAYRIVLMKPARKFLEKQPPRRQEQLLRAIYKLPHEGDIKSMSNTGNDYRLRVGSYRVIYSLHDDILTVEVMDIGNRGDIYK